MSPPDGDGARVTPGAAHTGPAATKPQDQTQGSAAYRLPVVAAAAVPPMGRRRQWLLWVPSCPLCGYGHAHRAAAPVDGPRRAGCLLGFYHLRVAHRPGVAA